MVLEYYKISTYRKPYGVSFQGIVIHYTGNGACLFSAQPPHRQRLAMHRDVVSFARFFFWVFTVDLRLRVARGFAALLVQGFKVDKGV